MRPWVHSSAFSRQISEIKEWGLIVELMVARIGIERIEEKGSRFRVQGSGVRV